MLFLGRFLNDNDWLHDDAFTWLVLELLYDRWVSNQVPDEVNLAIWLYKSLRQGCVRDQGVWNHMIRQHLQAGLELSIVSLFSVDGRLFIQSLREVSLQHSVAGKLLLELYGFVICDVFVGERLQYSLHSFSELVELFPQYRQAEELVTFTEIFVQFRLNLVHRLRVNFRLNECDHRSIKVFGKLPSFFVLVVA